MSRATTGTTDRRAALFREPALNVAKRWTLGVAWALKSGRAAGLPALTAAWAHDLLVPNRELPDPKMALAQPPGLAGIVHDLSVDTLVAAYRRGIYPFAHIPPLKWWSPPQRCVLFFDEIHISRKMRQLMRQDRYTVTFDRDFEGVIAACAGPRSGRWHLTWITPRIMRAYADAYDAGYAHGFEVWNERGKLVGGGYGFTVGASFSGESQFSLETNTSKLGLCTLNYHLARWGYHFDDGKTMTPTMHDMGFRDIPRAEFLARLEQAVRAPGKSGRWQVEADLKSVAEWRPAGAPCGN